MGGGRRQRLLAFALLALLHGACGARPQLLRQRHKQSQRQQQNDDSSSPLLLPDLAGRGRRRLGGTRISSDIAAASEAVHEKRMMRKRAAGEKIALAAEEEPAAKTGAKKKKKKKGKKMSKEEAIKAAHAAQAAAAAALEKGGTHEDAAKAADALLKEKGATEITEGLMSAEDVEKAEGRPAPFKGKGEAEEPAPAKKGKKKKKGAAAAAAAAEKAEGEGAASEGADAAAPADAEAGEGADAATEAAVEPPKKKKKKGAAAKAEPAAEEAAKEDPPPEEAPAEEAPADTPKKKKKKKGSKKAAAAVAAEEEVASDATDRKLAAAQRMTPEAALSQHQGIGGDDTYEGDDAYFGEDDDAEGMEYAEAHVAAAAVPVLARAAAPPAADARTGRAANAPLMQPSLVAAAATEAVAVQAAAPALAKLSGVEAAAAAVEVAAQTPAGVGALPKPTEVSDDLLTRLLRASAAAVARDAAALVQALAGRRAGPQPGDGGVTLQTSPANAAAQWQEKQAAASANTKPQAQARVSPPPKVASKGAPPSLHDEADTAEVARRLPPWFAKDPLAGKEKVAKVGAAGRHKGKVAVGAEEKWLRSHLRHLQEVKDGYDVIMYGDDIVEAWRGTFQGQNYHSFNDIPAVWEQYFGNKAYKALAAGIAGDTVEMLGWRLRNGELPPIIPPKVVVVACGTNSKGLEGECAVGAANGTAAQMTDMLGFLRSALPGARVVLQAVLPKGDFWPNRCTPAVNLFNANLQAIAEADPLMHYVDFGSSFLAHRAANAWITNTTVPLKAEINESYMPDALHPSASGMRQLAASLEPLVSRLASEAWAEAETAATQAAAAAQTA